MANCRVKECKNQSDHNTGGATGLCCKHYRKQRKYGDPLSGKENQKRHGEGTVTKRGYHMMGIKGRSVFRHHLIIEKALGHEIPKGSVSHHIDGDQLNNVNSNLVLCDSQAYHHLIHMRTRAYKACGHANWRKCHHCKKYDAPENMFCSKNQTRAYHRSCHREYENQKGGGK